MSLRSLLRVLGHAVAMTIAAGAAQAATTVVYVANADSQEVSVLALDRARGALTPIETIATGGVTMPMALSPNQRVLYVGMRSQPFRVIAYAIDPASGRLKKLGESALADSMANIDVDRSGRWLFAASYGGHKISVNAIGADGVVGAVQQVVLTKPHAHAIHADAANRFVFATSLGGDQLSAWRFDAATGQLSPNDPAITASAPRSCGAMSLNPKLTATDGTPAARAAPMSKVVSPTNAVRPPPTRATYSWIMSGAGLARPGPSVSPPITAAKRCAMQTHHCLRG